MQWVYASTYTYTYRNTNTYQLADMSQLCVILTIFDKHSGMTNLAFGHFGILAFWQNANVNDGDGDGDGDEDRS